MVIDKWRALKAGSLKYSSLIMKGNNKSVSAPTLVIRAHLNTFHKMGEIQPQLTQQMNVEYDQINSVG